ncbi:MAG: STAS domain-containing protein [candidate division KSB1 bacterium]|nr:STAS domain-containing protein [candidate division KSB1 bacterium]MDZ7318328.1 STAS domain-containing protein [candidate division KSB1 bacterium]MDZ7340003.1 STAS domain-containing protein [candidate division KSB1 bacterium]
MGFTIEEKDGITILKVDEDRLDSMVSPQLKSEFLVLSNQGVKRILIDLSQVTYVDSSGLGALLFGSRQLKNNQGQLKLLAANERVMNLIRIARLENHLVNYAKEQDALRSFC